MLGNEHIGRFEIAVHDTGLVCPCQSVGELDRPGEDLFECQSIGDGLVERSALDVLHGDIGDAIVAAHVVDGHDVGMVEGGGGSCLLLEAAMTVCVRDRGGSQDLDREVTVEALVASAVDLTHASGPYGFQDLVAAELGASGQRHESGGFQRRSVTVEPLSMGGRRNYHQA